jgi:putative DNA primase/helicase
MLQKLIIHEGSSRTETKWVGKEYSWDELVSKLSVHIRRKETMLDYVNMSVSARSSLKDSGGFVGGSLKGGRRTIDNVAWRSLITLDADNGSDAMIEKFRSLGLSGVIYSTFSHTPEKPKYRVVIPTETPVPVDFYVALINYFANVLDEVHFDSSTDDPSRLMYWPCCPTDAEPYFEEFKGDFFNHETFFEKHPHWLDASMWHLSASRRKSITDRIHKNEVEDPTLKRPPIGTFCRLYGIRRTLEDLLPGIYIDGSSDDRYTYYLSELKDGAIVYDDKWLYSHHGHDPVNGLLCNSWDLVRLHKFGHKDKGVQLSSDINKHPSHLAMLEYVEGMEDVSQAIVHEVWIESQKALSDDFEDCDWMSYIRVNKKGVPVDNIQNCRNFLLHDPRLKDKIRYNELADRMQACKSLPWRGGLDVSWSDADTARLYLYFESMGIKNRSNITNAWSGIVFDKRFHPIRDYLNGLSWDGVSRIESLFIDYLGAKDTVFVREATRKWMVAAVARVMEPGAQFDSMLLLIGPQGVGKSTILRRLAGPEWFTDSLDKLGGGKESAEQLKGYWVICIDELSALKKVGEAQEQVKNFISRRSDSFRPAYGHHVVDNPRQCVFAGTTNEKEFLRDYTGARRFWPIEVYTKHEDIWSEKFPRDQLWAEAYTLYILGEELRLSEEAEALSIKVQQEHTVVHDMTSSIIEFIKRPIPESWYDMELSARRNWLANEPNDEPTMLRKFITSWEIYCEFMGYDPTDLPSKKSREINDYLRSIRFLKYEGSMRLKPYGKCRIYVVERNEL